MKFTHIEDGKTYTFLRNLNTEKIFRQETGTELNAQLGELAYQLEAMNEASVTDPKALYAGVMDLTFIETRNEVLRFMYAMPNGAGVLVQNEETRKAFDELKITKNEVLISYFRTI